MEQPVDLIDDLDPEELGYTEPEWEPVKVAGWLTSTEDGTAYWGVILPDHTGCDRHGEVCA